MKRRNVLYGLGLAGLASSVTALTGATLANTVRPTADFRVTVDSGLLVEKGTAFPASGESTTVSSFGGTPDNNDVRFITSSNSDSSVFTELDEQSSFTAVADDEHNESLHIGIAIPFDQIPDADGSDRVYEFPDLLQITNKTSASVDTAIAFGDNITGINGSHNNPASAPTTDAANGFDMSTPAGSSDPAVSPTGNLSNPTKLSFDEVAMMFQFTTDGTIAQAISARGGTGTSNKNQQEDASVTINIDETQSISLAIELRKETGQKIHDYVNQQSLVHGGHFSLVDQIFVGESDVTPLPL
jgi:hypothetical protein